MKPKQSLDELAIFTGQPASPEPLHVGRPNVGDRRRLMERLNDVLDSRWLTNAGPYEKAFEKRIAGLTGVRHCIAICNATVALEIAIRALGLTGEVIVPSFTFVATAHALKWQQITPVFADIDPGTHTIDPASVERLITSQTTAIIGVHVWGHACNIEALDELARRHKLKLLFDSAHAFGCSHHGAAIGGFGDAEVFSFHATKFLNALEGGAITTNDDELARKIRLMRNFGFTDYDQVSYIGTNGKMNEASAAMGITSLESIDDFIAVNRSNYHHYAKELAGVDGVSLVRYDENEKCNYQYVVLEVDSNRTTVTRDQLFKILHAENILARRYFHPGCHRLEPYRTDNPDAGRHLPETEALTERVLCLPTGTGVGSDEISAICGLVRLTVENGVEINRLLSHAELSIAAVE